MEKTPCASTPIDKNRQFFFHFHDKNQMYFFAFDVRSEKKLEEKNCTAHSTSIKYNKISISLHSTPLHSTPLHFTSLHFTSISTSLQSQPHFNLSSLQSQPHLSPHIMNGTTQMNSTKKYKDPYDFKITYINEEGTKKIRLSELAPEPSEPLNIEKFLDESKELVEAHKYRVTQSIKRILVIP
jgi:hypothetical protein